MFGVTVEKDVLRWTAYGGLSQRCEQEYREWERTAIEHEDEHERRIITHIRQINASWAPPESLIQARVCGESEFEASDNAHQLVRDYLNRECVRIITRLQEIGEKYYQEPGGTVRNIECGYCSCATPCAQCEWCFNGICADTHPFFGRSIQCGAMCCRSGRVCCGDPPVCCVQ